MTITNGYITLADLKGHVHSNGGGTFSVENDYNMSLAIEAASRYLDERFNTTFTARTETRYYTAEMYDLLWIDDLLSVTTLKTDDNDDGTHETTWQTTDYWLEPRNAQLGHAPKPYRQIRINRNGDYSFPIGVEYGVEIVGSWGYSTTPPVAIKQAATLIAHMVWKRQDLIFGAGGTIALGVTTITRLVKEDYDVNRMLSAISERGF